MIRERRLNSPVFTPGQVVSTELPKDAVYHQIQLELDGKITIAYGAAVGASVNTQLAEGFPFSLISKIRLIRNGSDVVYQATGKQLAKEQLYMNQRFPFARLWFDSTSTNGTPNSLLTKTINGVTVPSNSEGIGCNAAVFTDTAAQSATNVIDFRCLLEMWLQLGVDDSYFTTLVDARPLASYVLEITWANTSEYCVLGSQNAVTATVTPTVNCSVQSYDQDNLQSGIAFGTFKRASFQPPGIGFGSNNTQALLPRGNLYMGIIAESLGLKASGLATIAQPGNDIVGEIQNRINSNYLLRDVFFKDLQAKNRNEGMVPSSPYDTWGGGPLGWAYLYFPSTGRTIKELVASYTMDQFDLLISTNSATGAGDGNVYNGTPTMNLLTQEVIPGRSVSASSARGAFAGSAVATSAKPGM